MGLVDAFSTALTDTAPALVSKVIGAFYNLIAVNILGFAWEKTEPLLTKQPLPANTAFTGPDPGGVSVLFEPAMNVIDSVILPISLLLLTISIIIILFVSVLDQAPEIDLDIDDIRGRVIFAPLLISLWPPLATLMLLIGAGLASIFQPELFGSTPGGYNKVIEEMSDPSAFSGDLGAGAASLLGLFFASSGLLVIAIVGILAIVRLFAIPLLFVLGPILITMWTFDSDAIDFSFATTGIKWFVGLALFPVGAELLLSFIPAMFAVFYSGGPLESLKPIVFPILIVALPLLAGLLPWALVISTSKVMSATKEVGGAAAGVATGGASLAAGATSRIGSAAASKAANSPKTQTAKSGLMSAYGSAKNSDFVDGFKNSTTRSHASTVKSYASSAKGAASEGKEAAGVVSEFASSRYAYGRDTASAAASQMGIEKDEDGKIAGRDVETYTGTKFRKAFSSVAGTANTGGGGMRRDVTNEVVGKRKKRNAQEGEPEAVAGNDDYSDKEKSMLAAEQEAHARYLENDVDDFASTELGQVYIDQNDMGHIEDEQINQEVDFNEVADWTQKHVLMDDDKDESIDPTDIGVASPDGETESILDEISYNYKELANMADGDGNSIASRHGLEDTRNKSKTGPMQEEAGLHHGYVERTAVEGDYGTQMKTQTGSGPDSEYILLGDSASRNVTVETTTMDSEGEQKVKEAMGAQVESVQSMLNGITVGDDMQDIMDELPHQVGQAVEDSLDSGGLEDALDDIKTAIEKDRTIQNDPSITISQDELAQNTLDREVVDELQRVADEHIEESMKNAVDHFADNGVSNPVDQVASQLAATADSLNNDSSTRDELRVAIESDNPRQEIRDSSSFTTAQVAELEQATETVESTLGEN